VSAFGQPVDANPSATTAATLRRLFDASFAAAESSTLDRIENLLTLRVGADPYALRLSEVSGLRADRKIVPVPGPAAQLLGIVGLRGVMTPVYDLAALLHYPLATNPRWIILAGSPQAVGFAFETFEAHLRVPAASLSHHDTQSEHSGAARQHVSGTVRVAGALRPIIHLASIWVRIKDGHL
jgi:purine-binding chemotaxis protein CheW